MTAEIIAKYEAAGFKRWTKGNMDRLYINATDLGLNVEYYNTGNVRNATWQGERVSNADGRRLLATKLWVDVETGESHIRSDYNDYCDDLSLKDILAAYISEHVTAEEA